MDLKHTLTTHIYTVTFDLKETDRVTHTGSPILFTNVTLSLLNGQYVFNAINEISDYSLDDWLRLISYFREHVAKILDGKSETSHVWLTYEPTFECQAIESSLEDQTFVLEFRVLVQRTEKIGNKMFWDGYAGAISSVELDEIIRFTDALEADILQIKDGRK